VTRRRNGQEFGQSLHHRQNDYLQPRHRGRLNHDDDRTVALLSARCACHPLRGGYRVPHGRGHAALVEQIDVGEPAGGGGHNILGLWDGSRDPRPVDLDDQHLLFEVERKGATVPYSAKPTGV
jgi:hypothetical protein